MATKTKTKAPSGKRVQLHKRMGVTDPLLMAITRGEWEKLNGFHDGRYEK